MEAPLILVIVIVASCVGTMTGFGISTIMIPVMRTLGYPLSETLLFVGIVHLCGNLWKLILFKRGFRWNIVLSFGVPGIAATYLGASLLRNISEVILSRILGTFLIGYVVYLFAKSSFRIKPGLVTGACGGALSGFLAGLFGIGGAVRGMFLTTFDLPKEVYITTAGAIAMIVDVTRLTKYVSDGVRVKELLLWGLIVFIPASFLAARAAKSVIDKIPQEHFRKVIATFLFLIGIKLILFPA